MYSVVAGTLLGAWLVGRRRPRTKTIRREALGSQSGAVYQVDEFPEAGFLVVRIPGTCTVVLERKAQGGFVIRRAEGTPTALEAVKRDFQSK
jgi:hypothetical protein